jgi:hypothetical protein
MVENLNLNGLNVTYCYDEFHIQLDKPLSEQIWELNEDIIQLQIDNKYTIDLGYYPSHSLNGKFKVCIIKDLEWSNPIWIKTCKSQNILFNLLQEAIDVVKKLSL